MPDDGTSERVVAVTRRGTGPVHVRHPRQPTLTLCGRTVDRYPSSKLAATSPVGCPTCRVSRLARLDRAARGVPELCWAFPREMGRISRTRCEQPLDGHRKDRGGNDLHDGCDDPSDHVLVTCIGCESYVELWEAERDGWQPLRGKSMLDGERARCPACAKAAAST